MNLRTKNSGFTLVETMVAVTILALSVVGPMVTAGRAIFAAQTARDQLTASYLAQQGVEYVRWLRDNDYLVEYAVGGTDISTRAWNRFIQGPNGNDGIESLCRDAPCTVDPHAPVQGIGSSVVPGSSPLYTTVYGEYTQQSAGNTVSSFTRTIQVTPISATEEKVTAVVSWSFHGIPYSITITNHLLAWQ